MWFIIIFLVFFAKYFINEKKQNDLIKIIGVTPKILNEIFQKKERIHKLIFKSVSSALITFIIIYYIFNELNIISDDSLYFTVNISVLLGMSIYFSRINREGLKIFNDNINFIKDFLYENIAFKIIEYENITDKNIEAFDNLKRQISDLYMDKLGVRMVEDNKNKKRFMCYKNDWIVSIDFFETTIRMGKHYSRKIVFNSKIIRSNTLEIDNSVKIQEVLNKYSFLKVQKSLNGFNSSLTLDNSTYKFMFAYFYAILNLTNEILNIE